MGLVTFLLGFASGVGVAMLWTRDRPDRSGERIERPQLVRRVVLSVVGLAVGLSVFGVLPAWSEAPFLGAGMGSCLTYLVRFGPANHPDYMKK